jgi:hypothetical protein
MQINENATFWESSRLKLVYEIEYVPFDDSFAVEQAGMCKLLVQIETL